MNQEFRVLPQAVSVKNAVLSRIKNEYGTKYVLQHYNTIILEIVNNEILIIKPNISNTSNKAINQAFDYLGINDTAADYRFKTDRIDRDNTENRAEAKQIMFEQQQQELRALLHKGD